MIRRLMARLRNFRRYLPATRGYVDRAADHAAKRLYRMRYEIEQQVPWPCCEKCAEPVPAYFLAALRGTLPRPAVAGTCIECGAAFDRGEFARMLARSE